MVSALAPPTMTFAPWPAVTVLAPFAGVDDVVACTGGERIGAGAGKYGEVFEAAVDGDEASPAAGFRKVAGRIARDGARRQVIVDDQTIGPQPAGHRVGAL